MSEWKRVKLGDVTEILTGFPFKSTDYTDGDEAVRLLRGDNIGQGTLRWGGAKRWPNDTSDDYSNYRLQEGDVVLAMDRPWIEAGLKYATVREADLPCLLVQRVSRLRGGKHLETSFLKFLIGGRAFTDHVLAVQTGTAVPHISAGQIKSFEFLLPSLSEQQAIASTLGALDDKIDLNRRMNEALEEMARALFTDWFVNFGPTKAKMEGRGPYLEADLWALFPERLDEEGKPEGWLQGSLGDFYSVGLGGAWGQEDETAKASVPVHCLRGIDCHVLAEGEMPSVPIRWLGPRQAAARALEEGTILIEGSGSFCGRSLLWRKDFATLFQGQVGYSNFCKRLDAKCSPAIGAVCWMHLRLAYRQGAIWSFRTGTAFPNLDVQGLLTNVKVTVPPENIAGAFSSFVGFSQRVDLLEQNRTLADMRDLLLPKLMSGEIRLQDAETLVSKAV